MIQKTDENGYTKGKGEGVLTLKEDTTRAEAAEHNVSRHAFCKSVEACKHIQ